MRIETEYVHPPIPSRSFDWSAVDADTYDGAEDSHPRNRIIGRGPTEQAAITDLLQQLEEADE